MAVLQQPVVGGNVFAEVIGDDLAPAGTYAATVIDIVDEFGVQRQKFQSTEIETVDLTTFCFGFRDAQGFEHRVASRRMKISGNEKATLFSFLKSLLGRAPQFGWDYLELKGAQCLLTVEHIQRRDGTGVFAGIAALSPVPAGMAGGVGQRSEVGGPRSVGMAPAAGPAVGQFGGRTVSPAPAVGQFGSRTVSPAPMAGRPAAAMPARPMAGQAVGRLGGQGTGQAVGPLGGQAVAAEHPIPF